MDCGRIEENRRTLSASRKYNDDDTQGVPFGEDACAAHRTIEDPETDKISDELISGDKNQKHNKAFAN